MHKTQLFIRDDQYQILQNLASVTGKKQSVLIREGIDLFIKDLERKQLWKEKLMALSGSITDEEGEEMKSDIHESRTNWKKRGITL